MVEKRRNNKVPLAVCWVLLWLQFSGIVHRLMGPEMDLEFDRYCRVLGSPKTVLLPSPRPHSKVEKRRRIKRKLSRPNVILGLEEDFVEINLHGNPSLPTKIIPYPMLERNAAVNRDSLCQISTEIRKLKKIGTMEGRRKIDFLCRYDEDSSLMEWKRSSAMSPSQELGTHSRQDQNLEIEKAEDPKFVSYPKVIGPISDGNGFQERGTALISHESLAAKLALPHSPPQSESDSSTPSSPKEQFSSFRKMFDPFAKPKSQWNPSTLRKSLLNDFTKDSSTLGVPSSPAHMHGCLKLKNKHGVPFFEFSLKSPEDVFVARTWKTESSPNRVFTFHHRRKSSSSSGWRLKDRIKESSLVAQMQESSYLRTKLKDTTGAFDNSVVTEFVLHDIVHARESVVAQENPKQSTNCGKATPGPWEPADLHPCLEIAAIVVQVPFQKRGNLMYKEGDAKSDQLHPNLLDLSAVNVVTPCGNHSLPNTDSRGPLPLLDRWRLGGGCDCGGWDTACPLTVFGNPRFNSADHHQSMENQQPLELFVQGSKANSPALSMTVVEEGQYSVDFQEELSVLQAFSICVAMLHCTKALTFVRHESDNQLSKFNSLAVFTEAEVKNLRKAVDEEEKRKVSKKIEEIQLSFKLNPPFSPVSRFRNGPLAMVREEML
ncbi:hypothetical protein Vadar_007636 [Vaccinium darrowii]|uniref:Uncharacterized protein n=1 Tax=Vaccinium darrowii TaxID=229202 RepID=A0ACB7ZB30_9ERIC|nr:hypothetical protein Vadar_007636 [Vaccinium darrowii]